MPPTQIPANARITKPYWKPLPKTGALRVRARCAVRPAVPSDAVPRVVHADGRRHRAALRAAGRVPLRGAAARRRKADGADGRAAARAAGDAVDCDRSRRARRDRRGRIAKCASPWRTMPRARRPDRCAWTRRPDGRRRRRATGEFHARRRGADRALRAAARGKDAAGAVRREIGRVGRGAERSTPDFRSSSTRTSAGVSSRFPHRSP